MKKLVRFIYRIFIKNAVIRWMWLLALGVYGIKWSSENLLGKSKPVPKKAVLKIENHTIVNFSIQKGQEDEMVFARKDDSTWFVSKGNITAKIKEDTIASFLKFFNEMKSGVVKKLPADIEEGTWKPTMSVDITLKNTATRAFTIFYAEKDTGNTLVTYIKVPKKRLLLGVQGDIYSLLNPVFNDYRDKNIVRFKADSLTQFIVRNRKDTLSFERKDSTWQCTHERFQVLLKPFKNYLYRMDTLHGFYYYDDSREILDKKTIDSQFVMYEKKDSTVLTTYRTNKGFIVHSTQNNDSYFLLDSTYLGYRDIRGIVKAERKVRGKKK
jgi:Domain of unknown function (DUF4340)